MSLSLERSGVNISTCQRGKGYSNQFLEIYGSGFVREAPMGQAVDIIRDRLDDPALADSVCMKGLKSAIGSMRPVNRKVPPFDNVFVWLETSQGEDLERAFMTAEGLPPVDMLGVEIDPTEFVAAAEYIMTNTYLVETRLSGEPLGASGSDPRLSLMEHLRAEG